MLFRLALVSYIGCGVRQGASAGRWVAGSHTDGESVLWNRDSNLGRVSTVRTWEP